MKIQLILGIVLLVAGAWLVSKGGFTTTNRERVLDAGPIKVDADVSRDHEIPAPVGWAVVAGGVVLIALGVKGK